MPSEPESWSFPRRRVSRGPSGGRARRRRRIARLARASGRTRPDAVRRRRPDYGQHVVQERPPRPEGPTVASASPGRTSPGAPGLLSVLGAWFGVALRRVR